jgi:hypothetical protein
VIAFVAYTIFFAALIYTTAFFGLFKDNTLSKKQYTLFFIAKALAVPVFYVLYEKYYGGINNLDAGKFFKDTQVLNSIAYDNFWEYIKILVGVQNETEGSYCYQNLLLKTQQWDNGLIRSFLFNDNRILIRIHSIFHFISFNSYFVQALFCSFYSLIGIHLSYKALKPVFKNKAFLFVACFVFFPSLWLFTGALLKESITFLCIGLILFTWKKLSETKSIKFLIIAFLLLISSILLKPYILLPVYFFFGMYFLLPPTFKFKTFLISSISASIIGFIGLNSALQKYKNKGIVDAFSSRQTQFNAVAQGGIFLANDSVFLRLENDSSLLTRIKTNNENNLRIKKGAAYTYWMNNNNKDTLYCQYNLDTLSLYHDMFRITSSKSNLQIPIINNSYQRFFKYSPTALYYVCFYPFFFNAHGFLEYLVSFENLVFMLALLLIVLSFYKSEHKKLIFIVLFCCSLLFIIIGYTSPNLGAIVRYRCLLMPFIISLGVIAIVRPSGFWQRTYSKP